MVINKVTALQCVIRIKGKVQVGRTLKLHVASVVISIILALKRKITHYPGTGQDKDCTLRMNQATKQFIARNRWFPIHLQCFTKFTNE